VLKSTNAVKKSHKMAVTMLQTLQIKNFLPLLLRANLSKSGSINASRLTFLLTQSQPGRFGAEISVFTMQI
jgi:hypothetical protein